MHTLTKAPLSVVLRRLPVHTHLTASPNHVCDGDASHTHTRDAETETRRRKRSPTTHSGAWADVAWHGQNRARCFLRRYVKHRGPSVTPYLLPVWRLGGKLLWRCHLVGVSRSQHERIHRVQGGRERETWRKDSLCPPPAVPRCFRKLLSILINIDYFVIQEQHADWPLHLIWTVILLNLHSFKSLPHWSKYLLIWGDISFAVEQEYDNVHLNWNALLGHTFEVKPWKKTRSASEPAAFFFFFLLYCSQSVAHRGYLETCNAFRGFIFILYSLSYAAAF